MLCKSDLNLLPIQILCLRPFAGVNSSTVYSDVLDMCSDMSRISKTFYLTSPAFPGDFSGTGICMCTAKPIETNRFTASIHIEHIVLSDPNVCNAAFRIFIIDDKKENVSECSPSQIKPRKYVFDAREIQISLRRKVTINTSKKTVVLVGIHGKFTEI